MATKKITFDPDAGVPVGSNLTIYTGADFNATFDVYNTSNAIYSQANGGFTTSWSGSSQLQKGAGVGATTVPAATATTVPAATMTTPTPFDYSQWPQFDERYLGHYANWGIPSQSWPQYDYWNQIAKTFPGMW